MKKIYLLLFLLLSTSMLAEDYSYSGASINEKKFNQLFNKFKNLLYTDGKNVYDLRIGNKVKLDTADANAVRKFTSRDDGRADGIIYKIENKNSFLLKIGSMVVYVTGNVDTTNLSEITKYTALLGHLGTHRYKKENGKEFDLRKCTVLKPVTKELFKEYIKDKRLFTYKKVVSQVPARKKLCMICKGDGLYGHKKKPCGTCKRTGTVVASWKKQTTWKKEEVK